MNKGIEILESYWDDEKTRRQFIMPKKDGRNHGLIQWWYSSDVREVIATVNNGERNGAIVWFDKDDEFFI